MTDQTTRRAEQIREETGCAWEIACQRAERERDATEHTSDDRRPITDTSGESIYDWGNR